MFPTCSKSDLAGRNALSATDLTMISSGDRRTGPRRSKSIRWTGRAPPTTDGAERVPISRADRVRYRAEEVACGGMFGALWGRRSPQAPTHRVDSQALGRVLRP